MEPAPHATIQGLPVGHRLHEFEILGVIGVGGFSIVYLAHDHQLHRDVALKEYIPATLAARGAEHQVVVVSERERDTFKLGLGSFVNEARLLASFDHPSLVRVYRFWEQNGTAYMVMPYCAGPTLKAVLHARVEPPDEAWLKRLLAPLLDALQTLHAARCYHRDISPDNILILGPPMTPLLLDFGAARRVIGNVSQALTAILKPGYAPIEQYVEAPSSRQGAWTDVYAVCAVLYTAISGRVPVTSVARLMSDDLEPIATVGQGRYGAAFLQAIDHGLAVRPEDRPQDIAALRAELYADAPTVLPASTVLPVLSVLSVPTLSEAEPLPARVAEEVTTVRYTDAEIDAARAALETAAARAAEQTAAARAADEAAAASARWPSRRSLALRVLPWAALGVVALGIGGAWRLMSPAPPIAGAHDAASAAPAAAPIARGEFSVVGVLDDIVRYADPALSVVAIADKDRVAIARDDIRIRITASEAGYLYVLFSGTGEPEIRLLYPSRRDRDNRIDANAELTLPTPASKLRMTAGGPAGVDHIVAIVSRSPRRFDAAGLGREAASTLDLPEFDLAQARALWTGATTADSPYAGAAQCDSVPGCARGYGAALLRITEVATGK